MTGCDPTTCRATPSGPTYTCTATSRGGTASQSVTVKLDQVAPLLSGAPTTVAERQRLVQDAGHDPLDVLRRAVGHRGHVPGQHDAELRRHRGHRERVGRRRRRQRHERHERAGADRHARAAHHGVGRADVEQRRRRAHAVADRQPLGRRLDELHRRRRRDAVGDVGRADDRRHPHGQVLEHRPRRQRRGHEHGDGADRQDRADDHRRRRRPAANGAGWNNTERDRHVHVRRLALGPRDRAPVRRRSPPKARARRSPGTAADIAGNTASTTAHAEHRQDPADDQRLGAGRRTPTAGTTRRSPRRSRAPTRCRASPRARARRRCRPTVPASRSREPRPTPPTTPRPRPFNGINIDQTPPTIVGRDRARPRTRAVGTTARSPCTFTCCRRDVGHRARRLPGRPDRLGRGHLDRRRDRSPTAPGTRASTSIVGAHRHDRAGHHRFADAGRERRRLEQHRRHGVVRLHRRRIRHRVRRLLAARDRRRRRRPGRHRYRARHRRQHGDHDGRAASTSTRRRRR